VAVIHFITSASPMTASIKNRIPLLLGLLGAGFIAYKFVKDETENYENNLGVTVKGFKPKWKITDPLNLFLYVDVDIRNDNHIGGQVLGFDGHITWGKDGAKLGALSVQPFDLKANGTVNKTTWVVKINLLNAPQGVVSQAKSGEWSQLPWMDGDLQTSYGKVTIKDPMIQLD
jgi:hypothetical protein